MHPFIENQVEKILQGPIEEMVSQWETLNKQYARPIDIYELGFDDLNKNNKNNTTSSPSISIEETVEILNLIGEKVFTKQISRIKPELILDFMDKYWGYVEPEEVTRLMKTNIYQDATAIDLYQLIITNQIYPDADPYFNYDPEHQLKLSIEHGINRKLFTESEIKDALNSQDKNSESYKRSVELHSMRYKRNHRSLKNTNTNLTQDNFEDYNIFFGRMYNQNSDNNEIYYASLEDGITCGIGPSLERVAEHMWEAVRKDQKILLTKNPSDNFKVLSPNELCKLYDYYTENPKHKLLPDPFLNQPKY